MEAIPRPREALIDELNVLTETKWDLLAEIQEIDLARAALMNQLRTPQPWNESPAHS